MSHALFMEAALEEARRSLASGEVPVGAALVVDGRIVSRAFNQPIASVDPTAHAEILVLQEGHDIWVWDLARQTFSRLTFDAGNFLPAQRADGRRLILFLVPCSSCGAVLAGGQWRRGGRSARQRRDRVRPDAGRREGDLHRRGRQLVRCEDAGTGGRAPGARGPRAALRRSSMDRTSLEPAMPDARTTFRPTARGSSWSSCPPLRRRA